MAAESRLGWYLKRLRVMSAGELVYRLGQAITTGCLFIQWRLGFGLARRRDVPVALDFCGQGERRLPEIRLDLAAAGASGAASHSGAWDGTDAWWHRAPDTGKQWPLVFFGAIPYRAGNPYGDIRRLWEPSRLQQLVASAALALSLEQDKRVPAVQAIAAELTSWVRANRRRLARWAALGALGAAASLELSRQADGLTHEHVLPDHEHLPRCLIAEAM